jgi:hypothetical protein
VQVRNDLWFVWLRRHRGRALRATGAALRVAARERRARSGVLRALAGVPWVLAERRPVPGWLERDLRRLEA